MPLPAFEPVASTRLTIRPIKETDLADLLEVNGDPAVTRFLPYDTWQSVEDGKTWLVRMTALAQAGTGQQFVLEINQSRTVVGTVLLFRYDESSQRAELGYVLGRKYWQQGLMREALERFVTYCFASLGLRRLEAEVNPVNEASNTLLVRLGFRKEGTLRERWTTKDAAYDTHIYGILSREWPVLHRRAPA